MMEDELEKYRKDNSYKVPENYFAESKARLLQIPKEDVHAEPQEKVIPLRQNRKIINWVFAAAAVLIAALFLFIPEGEAPDNIAYTLNDVTDEHIESYLETAYTFYSAEDYMVEEIPEEDLLQEEIYPEEDAEFPSELLEGEIDETLLYQYL